MTSTPSTTRDNFRAGLRQFLKVFAATLAVGFIFAGSIALIWFGETPAGAPIVQGVQTLLATNTVQAWWYVTRAAGLTSYVLLWLSMVWGLAIPTKFFSPAVEGAYSYDFHEFLSLLGLGFLLLHVVVLLFDQFLPFSFWQILIPFTDPYRPLWVGVGIIGGYLLLLVTITFYMRKAIGTQAFRGIHTLSLIAYLGATLHGLYAGTDSALGVTRVLYIGSALIVLFLSLYWLVLNWADKREKAQAAARTAMAKRRARRDQ